MSATATSAPVLEPAAQAFADATADHPFLFGLSISDGRKAVDDVQSGEISRPRSTRHGSTSAAVRPAR